MSQLMAEYHEKRMQVLVKVLKDIRDIRKHRDSYIFYGHPVTDTALLMIVERMAKDAIGDDSDGEVSKD